MASLLFYGFLQAETCKCLPATKQTVIAVMKKFWKSGFIDFEESKTDRRGKIVKLHVPESTLLPGHLNPTGTVQQGAQRSFLKL